MTVKVVVFFHYFTLACTLFHAIYCISGCINDWLVLDIIVSLLIIITSY